MSRSESKAQCKFGMIKEMDCSSINVHLVGSVVTLDSYRTSLVPSPGYFTSSGPNRTRAYWPARRWWQCQRGPGSADWIPSLSLTAIPGDQK